MPWDERGRPHCAQRAAVLLGDRPGLALLGDQIEASPWSCPRVEEAILTKTLVLWILSFCVAKQFPIDPRWVSDPLVELFHDESQI